MLVEDSLLFLFLPGAFFLPVTYVDEHDRVKHLHVIEQLANELGRPEAELKSLYEEILTDMQEEARIRDYLPILVSKRIKSMFKPVPGGACAGNFSASVELAGPAQRDAGARVPAIQRSGDSGPVPT